MAETKHADPSKDASLKSEVKDAVKEAADDAKTGNVETVKQTKGGPVVDLPTGTRRSHPAE